VARYSLMAGYAIDLPYSGRSAGLYEQALADFLVAKPTPTEASITFHEVGGRGWQRTRQINWRISASVADIARRTADAIGQFYGSDARVFSGATVDFRV